MTPRNYPLIRLSKENQTKRNQLILRLSSQGVTHANIAPQVRLATRSVSQIISKAKRKLENATNPN